MICAGKGVPCGVGSTHMYCRQASGQAMDMRVFNLLCNAQGSRASSGSALGDSAASVLHRHYTPATRCIIMVPTSHAGT